MNRSVWTLSLQCQESALQNYATMWEIATEISYGRKKKKWNWLVQIHEKFIPGTQIIWNGSLSQLYLQHINAQKEPSYCLLHLPRYARVAFLMCSGAPEAPTLCCWEPGRWGNLQIQGTALHSKTRKTGWNKVLLMGFLLLFQAGESLFLARSRETMWHGGIYICPTTFSIGQRSYSSHRPSQQMYMGLHMLARTMRKHCYIRFRLWSKCSSFYYTNLSTTCGSLTVADENIIKFKWYQLVFSNT